MTKKTKSDIHAPNQYHIAWKLSKGDEPSGTFCIRVDEQLTLLSCDEVCRTLLGTFFDVEKKRGEQESLKSILPLLLFDEVYKVVTDEAAKGRETIFFQISSSRAYAERALSFTARFICGMEVTEMSGFLREVRNNPGYDRTGKKRLEQLAKYAFRDTLTTALNRTAIEEQISNALIRASEEDTFALFMLDLDNFKQVNDKLGHQQGDKTLTRVVSAIRSVFRTSDLVGRLGGDEFVVFMSGPVSLDLIKKKASSLVNVLQISVGMTEIVSISASIGVVSVKGTMEFEKLYGLVDQALYTAKRQGKNRFHIIQTNQTLLLPQAPSADISDVIQLHTLLQYIDGGIILLEFGEKPRLLYFNPGYASILGQDSELGVTDEISFFSRMLPSDKRAVEIAIQDSARDGLPADIEFRMLGKEGNIRWIQAKAVPIPYEDSDNPVFIVLTTDVTKLRERDAALRESEERIRIAFDQTSQMLWEVNVRTKTFYIYGMKNQLNDGKYIFSGEPEALAETGIVHTTSKAAFVQFISELLAGRPEASSAFILRYLSSGIYGWVQLSYHMLFNEDGVPMKTIGIMQEMPTIFNEQERFRQEMVLFDALSGRDIEFIIANLTDDIIQSMTGVTDPVLNNCTRYSQFSEKSGDMVFSEEDTLIFKRFSPQELNEAYTNGITWAEAEYRSCDQQGNIHWTSCIVNLLVEPVRRELYVFLIRRNIDDRKRWELSLPSRAERDNVSHLYSRETTEAMVSSLILKRSWSNVPCYLVVLDINGLSLIADELGWEVAKQVRFSIGRLFRILLDQECVVGQFVEDRILLFWPELQPEIHLKALLDETVRTVRMVRETSSMLERISFSGGISSARCRQADFESMYTQASYVCDKNRHQSIIASFEDFEEENLRLINLGDIQTMVEADAEESLRPLTPDEKEVLLSCTLLILKEEHYGVAMAGVMGILGTYYNADRVYQLGLTPNEISLKSTYEWTRRGKHSLQKHFSGLSVSKMPVIQAAKNKKRTILLCGPSAWLGNQSPSEREWRYICAPIVKGETAAEFLCVENPRKRYADTALLSAIISIIQSGEEQRFNEESQSYRKRDSLTGLPDWGAYIQMLNSLQSDALLSLGVLFLEANGLDRINRSLGFEHGNSLLLYAADALSATFPKTEIFRLSSHSFVVLCRDMVHKAFTRRSDQLQAELDKQYPGQFSLGYTWADKDYTPSKLVEHAKSIMRYNNHSIAIREEENEAVNELHALDELKEAISQGRYCIYIQPKNRLSTGEIVGGEALVRYLDPVQGIVAPSEFINRMEKEHVIRELDFFVLDQTLSIMENWKRRGHRLVPVSVNFSRQTLLDRSSLASVLAIHSRYEIPAEYIEIEITETLGAMERRTIFDAVSRFRDEGFLISLDDFGSEYSSITMLSDIPFHTIKLDKSIISDFVTNRISRSIVEGMVKICKVMGAVCIAEGVETSDQVAALKETGCEYAQGYYYNKPLPHQDFEVKYLADRLI